MPPTPSPRSDPNGPMRAVIDTNIWVSGLIIRAALPARCRCAIRNDVPVVGAAVGRAERGEYNPSLYLALRIAEYFEVPVEVIFSTTPFPRIGSTERSA